MGLSSSKSLIDQNVLKAMESSPLPPNMQVVGNTETIESKNNYVVADSPTSSTSAAQPSLNLVNLSPTSSAPTPNSRMRRSPRRRSPSRRSPRRRSPRRLSPTSSAPVPIGGNYNSQTSTDFQSMDSSNGSNVVTLPASIFLSSEYEFKGGYTYAAELSTVNSEHHPYSGGNNETNIVTLDPAIFETSENQQGGQNPTSEFNPEKFFSEMQLGGLHHPNNKEHKKGQLEKILSPEGDDDDEDKDAEDKFSFAENTEGLDVDSNEDTEDLKQKVKHLRMMVSRSTGKKSSKKLRKSKSRKSKRMTPPPEESQESESTGGADNSISEYVNSTSSISTSDVRLISMNKMRKH